MSKFLDLTGLAALVDHLEDDIDTKVDKVEGKGLSANDFTDAYKSKLDGIAAGANKTVVDSTLNASRRCDRGLLL